jgi:hypothetical protein
VGALSSLLAFHFIGKGRDREEVSICSRSIRDSSDMMRTWNNGFGLSTFMTRRNEGASQTRLR